ncbi:MAG TPA: sulfatase [Gemmatimonadaceae bacterium]
MTPLAYIPYFAGLGVAVWAINLGVRRIAALDGVRPPSWQLPVLLWFGLLSLATLFPRLSTLSRVLLTLGMAVAVARWLRPRWTVAWPHLRRAALGSAAGLLVTGLGMYVVPEVRERRWLATHPPLPDAPNVLIIILDTVRAMSTSLHGAARQTTPHLVALAREGVVFDRAFSPAPWSHPSHSSLVTGRLPHELSASHLVPLDGAYPTLAEAFLGQGYATAAIVANLWYTSRHSGVLRGSLHIDDSEIGISQILWQAQIQHTVFAGELGVAISRESPLMTLVALLRLQWRTWARYPSYQRRWAPEVNEAFLGWVDGLGGRPFFAMLNYFDAHEPYEPPSGYRERYDSSGVVRKLDAYEGAIAYLDHHLGHLFDALRERGLLDRTIVVVSADHGEEFGEHGLWSHSYSVYPQVVHIPMLVRFPAAVPQGKRVDTPVQLCDVGRSVLELAGLPHQTFGRCGSLLPAIRGEAPGHDTGVVLEMMPESPEPGTAGPYTRALVEDSLYYIRWHDGREELYHHRLDPLATNDIAGSPDGLRLLPSLRDRLQRQLRIPRPDTLTPP